MIYCHGILALHNSTKEAKTSICPKKQLLSIFQENIFGLVSRTNIKSESPEFAVREAFDGTCTPNLPSQKHAAPLACPSGHSSATHLLCDLEEEFAAAAVAILTFPRPKDTYPDLTVLGEAASDQQSTTVHQLWWSSVNTDYFIQEDAIWML